MVVYICCAGGATSSLFCSKIKGVAKEDRVYFDDIKSVHKKYFNGELKDYNIILAYGAAQSVNKNFIETYEFKEMVEGVLISPQARYNYKDIKGLVEPLGIKCEVIDMRVFGKMDGEKGLELVKHLR